MVCPRGPSTWLPIRWDGSRQEAGVVGVCLWPEALTLQQPAVRRTVLGATGPRREVHPGVQTQDPGPRRWWRQRACGADAEQGRGVVFP